MGDGINLIGLDNVEYRSSYRYFSFIKLVENYYGLDLPRWYTNFLHYDLDSIYGRIEMDDYYMFSMFLKLEHVVDEIESRGYIQKKWLILNKMVPLCSDNGGGDYFFVSLISGKVYQTFHDAYFERLLVSENFQDFLNKFTF